MVELKDDMSWCSSSASIIPRSVRVSATAPTRLEAITPDAKKYLVHVIHGEDEEEQATTMELSESTITSSESNTPTTVFVEKTMSDEPATVEYKTTELMPSVKSKTNAGDTEDVPMSILVEGHMSADIIVDDASPGSTCKVKVATKIESNEDSIYMDWDEVDAADVPKDEIMEVANKEESLDLVKLCELLEKNQDGANCVEGKDILLLLGNTGSGKTSTLLFLCGVTFECEDVDGYDHFVPLNVPTNLADFAVSPGTQSVTKSIQASETVLDGEAVVICDVPGLLDTSGIVAEIYNQRGVLAALRKAKSVRPVLVMNIAEMSAGRCKLLSDALDTYQRMFRQDDSVNFRPFRYVFTRCPAKEAKRIHKKLVRFQDERCRNATKDAKDQLLAAFIQDMLAKTTPLAMTVDLEDDDATELLRSLWKDNDQCIMDPKNGFSDYLSESASEKLKLQLHALVENLRVDVESENFHLVYERMSMLNRVLTVLPESESFCRAGESIIVSSSNSCQLQLEHALDGLMNKEGAEFERQARHVQRLYSLQLEFAHVLEICSGTEKLDVAEVKQAVTERLTVSLLSAIPPACSQPPCDLLVLEKSLKRAIGGLYTLACVFRGTSLSQVCAQAFEKGLDKGVALVDGLLTGVMSALSLGYADIHVKVSRPINFAHRFYCFLVDDCAVVGRHIAASTLKLEKTCDSFAKVIESAHELLCKATKSMIPFMASKSDLKGNLDFENLGRARSFILLQVVHLDESDVCFCLTQERRNQARQVVDNFDRLPGNYIASVARLCDNLLEQSFLSDDDLPTRKNEADSIMKLLLGARRDCEICSVWPHFLYHETSRSQEALISCQLKLDGLANELAEEARCLAKGLHDATERAESILKQMQSDDRDPGYLLTQLSQADNWDHWSNLRTEKKSMFSGVFRTFRNVAGFSSNMDRLEKTQEKLLVLLFGRLSGAFTRLGRLGGNTCQYVNAMAVLEVRDNAINDLRLLLAFVQLPNDCTLISRLITHKNKNTFEMQLSETLQNVVQALSSVKSLSNGLIKERCFEKVANILSCWKRASALHDSLLTCSAIDVSKCQSSCYQNKVIKLRDCVSNWPSYEVLWKQAIDSIRSFKDEVERISFLPMLSCVNEDSREAFYKENAVRTLEAAQSLRSMETQPGSADAMLVSSVYPLVVERIESEINMMGSKLKSLVSEFPAKKDKFGSIYSLIGNLESINKAIGKAQPSLAHLAFETANEASQTMKNILDSRLSMAAVDSLGLKQLIDELMLLKVASREIPCWCNQIDTYIDNFIQSAVSSKSVSVLELSVTLREMNDCDAAIAQQLLSDHKCFEGVIHAAFNEATAGQDINYVLKNLSVDSTKSRQLLAMYTQFEKTYLDLVTKGLGERYRSGRSSGDWDTGTTKNAYLTKISDNASKIVEDYSVPYTSQVVTLSAHLFAYWSLDTGNSNCNDGLMKPHPAQVVAIWTMLNAPGQEFQMLENQLLELKTGEGKSIVLGVVAVILAMFGYDVDCICYSQFLSERDSAAFRSMFNAFQVKERIWYGTYEMLFRKVLDLYYELAQEQVWNRGGTQSKNCKSTRSRPTIMLVDEVDVFFGPDSFGSATCPLQVLRSQAIVDLFQYVWKRSGRLSTESLLEMNVAVSVLDSFPGCVRPLLKREICKLVKSAKAIKAGRHEYVVSDGKIGYKEFDGVNYTYLSNEVCFAYIKEHELGSVTAAIMKARVGLSFSIGSISNAEFPFRYDAVLGITGTLSSLGQTDRLTLQTKYELRNHLSIPSVFGENRLEFTKNSAADVKICNSQDDHFLELKHEIIRRRVSARKGFEDVQRSVMVFFDSKKTLLAFYESTYMQSLKSQTRTITETAPLKERNSLFLKATGTGAITLMIRDFGRGTDFKCHDKRMLQAGGVHVIQAFISVDLSEEIQIKGRCARQGADGSFSMVINAETLRNDLQMTAEDIEEIRDSGRIWDRLNQRRNKLAEDTARQRLVSVDEYEEHHYRTVACKKAMEDSTRRKDVISFFEELNGVSSRGAFQEDANRLIQQKVSDQKARRRKLLQAEKKKRKHARDEKKKLADIASNVSMSSEPLLIEASVEQTERARVREVIANGVDCRFQQLGVKVDASTQEIKEAYRVLAKLFHPDKCKDEDAKTIFQMLSDAKNFLLNESGRT